MLSRPWLGHEDEGATRLGGLFDCRAWMAAGLSSTLGSHQGSRRRTRAGVLPRKATRINK